jgi:adenine-specific DNA-methyltransferase
MTDENNIEKIDLDKVNWRGSREFFESLGETLDRLDDKDEAYDFTWVGKRKAVIEAGAPINKTFRPDLDGSKNWDTTENLFIEGDNLDALKLLQESYLGKVKMIYIDPPYNTGKDFVYHDNFKASVENYDADTDYKDESGNIQFKKNEKSNGRYHSDWLSMMYPRLKLARNLLRDDGVIFISIGEDEQSNLRKLCDEVYGEDNYIGTIVRKTKLTSNKGSFYSQSHEYILTYAKVIDSVEMFNDEESQTSDKYVKLFRNEDERGKYNVVSLYMPSLPNADERPNSRYGIKTPGGEVVYPPNNRIYRWKEESYFKNLADNRVVFKETKTSPLVNADGQQSKWNIYTKLYLHERQEQGILPSTLLDKYTNSEASKELIKLDIPFDFSKPKNLIAYLMKITGVKADDLVLDFFSGSGTTAHAVMHLNSKDGANRKWITIQLTEVTDEKSEAYKAGYKTIPEISHERIRRAGDKIAAESPEAKVDYGFRSLVITDTNYKEVYKPAGEQQQSTLLDVVDNIKDDRSELDLVYGVLTQSALELNRPFESKDIAGSKVFLYDYFGEVSGLIACFSFNVPEETVKEIAKLKPLTAVFRDSSFATSQDKVNLAEHFRILSPDTKVKVI